MLKYRTFCLKTLKCSTFCRIILKYGLKAGKKWLKVRWGRTPHFVLIWQDLQTSKQFIWQKYSTPGFVGPLNIFHSEGVLPEEEAQSIPVIGQRMASPLVWTSARYRLSGEWRYPNDFHQSRIIEVAKGHFINVQFKRFNLADSNDFVQITDGDGTFLGHFGPNIGLTNRGTSPALQKLSTFFSTPIRAVQKTAGSSSGVSIIFNLNI